MGTVGECRPERMFAHAEAEEFASGRSKRESERSLGVDPEARSLSYAMFVAALKYESFLEQVRRVMDDNLVRLLGFLGS